MAEMLFVNPRQSRRKGSRRKSRVSARRRRRTPRNPMALAPNPRRRKRRASPRRSRRVGFARRIARRTRGGRGFMTAGSFMRNTIMPSGIGAAGALGADLLIGYLPLPAALQGPALRPFIRLAAAVGIGMIAGMVAKRSTAEQVTAGAVTVVLYDTIKGIAKTAMPNLPLSGVDDDYPGLSYISAGMPVGEYVADQTVMPMGEYVP